MANLEHKTNFLKGNNIPSIIIGIVFTFIFTKLLDPLLEFIYSSFLNLGGNFITAISDWTYKEISNGFNDRGASFISYFLYLAMCFLLNFLLSTSNSYYKEKLKLLNDLEETASHNLSLIEEPDVTDSPPQKSMTNSIEEIIDNFEKVKNQHEENCKKIICYSSRMKKSISSPILLFARYLCVYLYFFVLYMRG